MATVCTGAFIGQLDASIVTVAFPTMQRSFHASVGAVTWVGITYLIVLVAGVAAMGRAADIVGRKLLYTYGFFVFTLGSGLCAISQSLLSLDAFRVVQGIGAAMLQANSVAIITLAVPRTALGRAIGVQGAAQALGLALGPTIGGLLVSSGGWRLIFLVNIVPGILGMVASSFLLPRSRDLQANGRFDWIGLGLFVPMIIGALTTLSFANSWGWSTPRTEWLVAASVILAACFLAFEHHSKEPMLELSLFAQRSFSAGTASSLCAYVGLFGTLSIVPFFLEHGHGVGVRQAGLTLTVLPLALGLVAPFAGKAADRFGTRALAVSGMSVVAVGLFLLAMTRPNGWGLYLLLAAIGLGFGAFIPVNNAGIMAAAPRHRAGVASGVLNMTRGIGTSIGLALTGLVLATGSTGQLSPHAIDRRFGAAMAVLGTFVAIGAMTAATNPGRLVIRPGETGAPDAHTRHKGEASARL